MQSNEPYIGSVRFFKNIIFFVLHPRRAHPDLTASTIAVMEGALMEGRFKIVKK